MGFPKLEIPFLFSIHKIVTPFD